MMKQSHESLVFNARRALTDASEGRFIDAAARFVSGSRLSDAAYLEDIWNKWSSVGGPFVRIDLEENPIRWEPVVHIAAVFERLTWSFRLNFDERGQIIGVFAIRHEHP